MCLCIDLLFTKISNHLHQYCWESTDDNNELRKMEKCATSFKATNINHKGNDLNKKQISDTLESKIMKINKKMQATISSSRKEMENLQRDATRLHAIAEKNNKLYEAQTKQQIQKMSKIESDLCRQIEVCKLERMERETMILEAFQQKSQGLKREIEHQRKVRQSLLTQISNTIIGNDLQELIIEIDEGNQHLNNQQLRARSNLNQHIQTNQSLLDQFRVEQHQNTSNSIELIRNLAIKVGKQLQHQKQACEVTYEQIIEYIKQKGSQCKPD